MSVLPAPALSDVTSPARYTSAKEALRAAAVIAGLRLILTDRDTEIRRYLTDQLDAGESVRVPRVGRVGVTDPQPHPRVTDADALARWMEAAWEDVSDVVVWRTAVDAGVVDAACRADPAVAAQLADLIPGAVVDRATVDPEAVAGLVESFARVDADERQLSGSLVDGNGEVIPGIVLEAKADPTLTVVVDRAAKERHRDAILDQISADRRLAAS